jgi:hypothetical protein
MKNCLTLTLIVFSAFVKLYGQDSKIGPNVVRLVVLISDNKKFVTDSNGLDSQGPESEAIQKGAIYINPAWIDSIRLVQGKEAVDKYGTQGQNGVLVVQLNKEALTEMAEESRKKFRY